MSSPSQIRTEGNNYIIYKTKVNDILTFYIREENSTKDSWNGKSSDAFCDKSNKIVKLIQNLSIELRNTSSQLNILSYKLEEEIQRRAAAATSAAAAKSKAAPAK